jgi:hypothetical protein
MAHEDPTTKTLAELGVSDAAGVARLFADVKQQLRESDGVVARRRRLGQVASRLARTEIERSHAHR